MSTPNIVIRVTRFVTWTLLHTMVVAIHTSEPLVEILFIIVLMDTFTRYIQIYPTNTVSATIANA